MFFYAILNKEAAEAFKKAICDETKSRRIADFTPYQVTFFRADGSSFTLWHLILEAEGTGDGRKLAVMTRDGKVRISDASSNGMARITSDTVTAVALICV